MTDDTHNNNYLPDTETKTTITTSTSHASLARHSCNKNYNPTPGNAPHSPNHSFTMSGLSAKKADNSQYCSSDDVNIHYPQGNGHNPNNNVSRSRLHTHTQVLNQTTQMSFNPINDHYSTTEISDSIVAMDTAMQNIMDGVSQGATATRTTITKSATQPTLCHTATIPSRASAASLCSLQGEETPGWPLGASCGGSVVSWPTAPGGGSTEDLQGEISDYTDAKSSVSAPVELLSEFLSAVMSRDYESALKLCQSILKYEPHNSTAKEFYPLIMLKIKQLSTAEGEGRSESSDEGHESDEGTMDSYSSLEDEIDDVCIGNGVDFSATGEKLANYREKSNLCADSLAKVRSRTTADTIIKIAGNADTTSCSGSSSAMSNSNSLDFSLGIDSGDSMFSSTESDLTLESVIRATENLRVGNP